MTSTANKIENGGADLHLHTVASDGLYQPEELVKKAKEMGFATIAVTDHDTTDSVAEALKAGKKLGVDVIAGIEISSSDEGKEVHILGYNIDVNNKELKATLNKMTEHRKTIAAKMVSKLNELGVKISYDRVKEIAGGNVVGRVHIATAMVEKGYIKEIKEAFTDEYIGNNGKAFVGKYHISPKDTIKLINNAGGVAVLAHPIYLGEDLKHSESKVAEYAKLGIEGIEAYYSKHSPEQTEAYKVMAKKYNLLITGGSDCHGLQEKLMGTVRLQPEYIAALKKRFSQNKTPDLTAVIQNKKANRL